MGAKSKAGGSGDYERPDNGTYAARCIQVVELGTHNKTWEGKTSSKEELLIVWELSELMEDGRPFVVNWRGTNSLSDRANLYKIITAWRGKSFTKQELEEFQLGKLLDACCMLSVVTEESKNGKEYTNVSSIMPLPKGMKAPERVNDLVDFGICDLGGEEWDKLYPWVQGVIEKSHEGLDFFDSAPPKKESQTEADDADSIPF